MVLNLKELQNEIKHLQEFGIQFKDRFFISKNVHLVMPYHTLLDGASENKLASDKIGTTLKGIGPTYQDKYARIGIRISISKFLIYNKICWLILLFIIYKIKRLIMIYLFRYYRRDL